MLTGVFILVVSGALALWLNWSEDQWLPATTWFLGVLGGMAFILNVLYCVKVYG